MVIPRRNRGKFHHQNTEYGESNLGNKLEIFLPDTTESNILILAGIHGDEPESIVFLSEALRSIPPDELKNPVILCANPDGILRGTRANANGVDLNRNFPVENWTDNPVFYRIKSGEPQDIELSTGTEPGSELETKAILKIIDEIKPQSIISFHSALDCIEDPNNTELGQWIASETGIPLVDDVGYPIILDAASNMGFGALLFSAFLPIQYIGGLMVFAMISTSLGTLTVLSALAELLKKKLIERR